jgi:hypothetical protein
MVDICCDCIRVFSYEGKLFRFIWVPTSPYQKCSGYNGIAIYHDTIFITNWKKSNIKALTCYGKSIFAFINLRLKYSGNILITYDYVYISNNFDSCIIVLKLIYK